MERKKFHLPPYTEMVAIRISDDSETLLRSRIATLASAIMTAAGSENSNSTVIYDHLLFEKRGGKYIQKILIRSDNILKFLEPFRSQLVRNRGIEVEWL